MQLENIADHKIHLAGRNIKPGVFELSEPVAHSTKLDIEHFKKLGMLQDFAAEAQKPDVKGEAADEAPKAKASAKKETAKAPSKASSKKAKSAEEKASN